MKKKVIASILALSLCAYSAVAENRVKDQDSTAILLNEVVISAGVSKKQTSPLRLKTVSSNEIQTISVARTYPEILSSTPGIYATRETGSYGDATVNIRGFKQENISILLNGIPISGLTSGSMYWNNWMGLTDATSVIQLQKGIGGSMLSDNSVGGTINIITISPSKKFSAGAGYYYAGYGTQKAFLNINSGDLGKGWAFNLSGSYTWGSGYVESTDVSAWSYLASISKKINSEHSLLFTALGSPEQHSQRSSRLSYSEIEQYGVGYNKNWGWYEGKERTISRNNYFKPYFTLNHFYNTTDAKGRKISLNSALYLAIGDGGGYYTESTGKKIISFQKDGHIDWDSVIGYNESQEAVNGRRASQNIMSDYQAGHTQAGAKTSFIIDFNDRISLETGLHYQLYATWEREQITDLLGGDYWVDGSKGEKVVGDFIRTYNGRNMHYGTVYGMGTFTLGENKNWIVKSGLSLSGVTMRRWDTYNYAPEDKWSDRASGLGGSFKGGVLYKADKHNSLYLNAGLYSRAPYYGVYFASGNNAISKDIKNENNVMGELGYRFVHDNFGAEATFYAALWKNKTIKSNPYKPLDDESYRFMVTGLDAFHYGGEMELFYRFGKVLRVDAFASIGDWRWKNDVHATIYDPYTEEPMELIDVYSHNLHVGDAPQTQVGASFEFHPLKLTNVMNSDITVSMRWCYNDRFWADFDPISRTDADDHSDSYRIPAYHLLDMNVSWSQRIRNTATVTLFFNLNNILDAVYVERGKDGAGHDAQSFTGYWGAPRNYNFGVRLSF